MPTSCSFSLMAAGPLGPPEDDRDLEEGKVRHIGTCISVIGGLLAEVSCGNVFADLGLPDADKRLAEANTWIEAGMPTRELVIHPADGDCECTPGAICRQNAACPRSIVIVRS